MVSSSSDEGTQKLYAEAPDLVLPALRPYRTRARSNLGARPEHREPPRVAAAAVPLRGDRRIPRLRRRRRLPVVRRVVQLAREHKLFLHSHSDAEPSNASSGRTQRRASCGRTPASTHRGRCARCCAGTRTCGATWPSAATTPAWERSTKAGAQRSSNSPTVFVGTDTFTPERWHYVVEHARWSRQWLADLPREVAERIAWKNGRRCSRHAGPARALMKTPGRCRPCCWAPRAGLGGLSAAARGRRAAGCRRGAAGVAGGRRHHRRRAPVCSAGHAVPADARLLRVDATMPEHATA